MMLAISLAAVPLLLASHGAAQSFVVYNGQIFTPGMAIVDSPQPGTPMGGDTLQVALDVTADGRLQLPPYPNNNPSVIYNITIFLYSYNTGMNFTIANGTSTGGGNQGNIMAQEPSSTVKHVNWVWPDCLVGDGQPRTTNSSRGVYNISIRQNYKLNGANHYTIFDMPISVTNSISAESDRPSCDSLNNPLLSPEQVNVTGANNVPILFAPNDSTVVQTNGNTGTGGTGGGGSGSNANPLGGLGAGSTLNWWSDAVWLCLASIALALFW